MYNYWRSNKNVILTAVALFLVSLTSLLYVLSGDTGVNQLGLSANVVDSIAIKSQMEQEKLFRSLADEHEGPLTVIDSHGILKFTSWDFESTMGYKMEDIKNTLYYEFINPDDLPLFLSGLGKTLTTKESVPMVGPYRTRTGNGEYRMHIATLYPIKSDDEEIENIIIAILDITESVETSSDNEEEQEQTGEETDGKSIQDTQSDEDTRLVVEL